MIIYIHNHIKKGSGVVMDNETNKKQQKPGLGAIRPDDWIEQKFRDICSDEGYSQTKLFEHIFIYYLNSKYTNQKEEALPISSEIQLISENLDNILNHFKSIADKAQNTVISNKNNLELTINNLRKDLETATSKCQAFEKDNHDLTESNHAFISARENLDKQIVDLKDALKNKSDDLRNVKAESADLLKEIKSLQQFCEDKKTTDKLLNKVKSELNIALDTINEKEHSITKLNNIIEELTSECQNLKDNYSQAIEEVQLKLKGDYNRSVEVLKIEYEKKIELLIDDSARNLELQKKELIYEKNISILNLREELLQEKNNVLELTHKLDKLSKSE